MKVLLVYNPRAGHGRAGKRLPEVEALARELGLDLDMRLTEAPGHGVKIVREADLDRYGSVVAGGGDGTLFETVNGYFRNPGEARPPLGVLPVGTGNAFARDLDLETGGVARALELVARGRPRRVDVGRFRTGLESPAGGNDGEELYYLNILGVGFVSEVTETAAKLKALGNIAYTLGVLYRTVFLGGHRLTIDLDGETLERDCTFMEISNTRYTADFLMAPQARIDDGLLDVTLAGRATRRRLLKLFPTVFTGEHVHQPEVETYTARRIRVESDGPKVLTPDGEVRGTTPVEVECLPGAVKVFA